MKMGLIGLGRMGNAIAYRLVSAGHEVIGFDLNQKACDDAREVGVNIADSIDDVAKESRVIWLMVPPGDPVDEVIKKLYEHLKSGDVIVDGGNSYFRDSMQRAQALAIKDIYYLDCGTSGGVHGRTKGFCLMVGGDKAAYTKIHQLLAAIAAPGGLGHVGPSGSGHYVKMVHNGIEYGMLQSYAEGFQILKEGSFKKAVLNLEEISGIWNKSSVIRSFLLGLAHEVFTEDQEFSGVEGKVDEGGTGKWTVEEAEKHEIPVPVIDAALKNRTWSRKTGGNYATKLIALLRNKFGEHEVHKKGTENENN